MNIIRILCGIILLTSMSGQAQTLEQPEVDTVFSLIDTTSVAPVALRDTVVRYDDMNLDVRKVEPDKIDKLKKDPELDYTVTPTVQSIWSRILWWIASLFLDLFSNTEGGSWIKYFLWGIGIAILIYVILRLLKIDALKVFYSGQGKAITYTAIDENIHEMDFDKLIAAAVASKDFRLAIRLQFLHALKILSDKHLIHWQPGKTNHDYMHELSRNELRAGFTELNEYFEYAWYGNFPIAPELFSKVQGIFNSWRKQA